jgi:hypothetical protein
MVPSSSMSQTRWMPFEYTTRRPLPESAGISSESPSSVLGGARVSATWTAVPRSAVPVPSAPSATLSTAGPGAAPYASGAAIATAAVQTRATSRGRRIRRMVAMLSRPAGRG